MANRELSIQRRPRRWLLAPVRASQAWRLIPKERAPHGMAWQIALSLLPGSVLFGVFFLVPLCVLVATSFSRWSVLNFDFVGLANYGQLLHDGAFWKAVANTALYAAAAVFIQVPLAILAALVLAERNPGWKIFRTTLFLPVVISGAAYALIFANVYNPRYGLLDRALGQLGVNGPDWLFTISTALPAVVGTYIFNIGFYMILVLTEITGLPPELAEAAEVDGASRLQRRVYITLPLLRHVIGTCVLLALLSSIAFFDIVFILTGGGPANATLTLTVYGFRVYASDQWGYANTVGLFIVVAGFLVIVAIRRLFRLGERET